jgi:hypothetical protein
MIRTVNREIPMNATYRAPISTAPKTAIVATSINAL